jgi:DNA-binding SARP family transcriptional activator
MNAQEIKPANDSVADCVRTADCPAPQKKPLMIYTLGRFSLARDGKAIQYSRKAPSRPLHLLKALIASGGRQVGAINLASILWPDQDGDRARQAFETTLHRLRKFLGDDRFLLLQDGCLSLNSELVWVDAWEFEHGVSELHSVILLPVNREHYPAIHHGGERAIRLYQGHFLARDDTACWSISMQERLRSKFIHCLIDLGRFWERQDMPSLAIHCYRKGIAVDDLVESFYQRLMVCFEQADRLPEAMATYRQCRHVLSVVLGLAPTAETQSIYRSILTRYKQAG